MLQSSAGSLSPGLNGHPTPPKTYGSRLSCNTNIRTFRVPSPAAPVNLSEWAYQHGLDYMLLAGFFAAVFSIPMAVVFVTPEPSIAVTPLGAIAGMAFQQALYRAAGRPALQALTCGITLVCPAVATFTRHVVGVFSWMACVPTGLAGGCLQA